MSDVDVFTGRCEGGHWRGPEADDTCSFCGSMKPSLALRAIAEGAMVTPTDKNYKLYIHSLASSKCPAGKCYINHFSESQAIEFVRMAETGKMKIDYPGHFYSGLGFGAYKDAINKLMDELEAAKPATPEAKL